MLVQLSRNSLSISRYSAEHSNKVEPISELCTLCMSI